MLVGVIQKKSLAEIRSLVQRMDAASYDLLELRLDACEDLSIEGLAAIPLPLPAIFTLRCRNEGGIYPHSETERLALLQELMRLAPAYVDIEAGAPPERIAAIRAMSPQTRVILSRHDFDRTPASLPAMLGEMRNVAENLIYKIAVRAANTLDALRMLVFCREQSQKGLSLIGISMGEPGLSTRILAPVVHTGFCYCPVEEASAPGQISAAVLRSAYNFSRLSRRTAIYGLLGDPVEQSVGHLYHNERNAATGSDAVYVKWRIAEEELAEALHLLLRLGVQGLSLTMPLKEKILPLVAGYDATVAAIGAVNTLKADQGGWSATNTDGAGALDALGIPLRGKKIVVLGAGGAARAVIHQAVIQGAEVRVYNRTEGKGLPAGLTTRPFVCLAELQSNPYDVIVNALPFALSFSFDQVPFFPETLAMDLSYGKKSAFLGQAQAAGCITMDGSDMFEKQARLQREFWGLLA